MALTDFMGITEIARCTGKTRPTVYKYLRSYEDGAVDDIPYTFLMLLQLADGASTCKGDILAYCAKHYGSTARTDTDEPALAKEIIELVQKHYEKLDLATLKQKLYEEISAHDKHTI